MALNLAFAMPPELQTRQVHCMLCPARSKGFRIPSRKTAFVFDVPSPAPLAPFADPPPNFVQSLVRIADCFEIDGPSLPVAEGGGVLSPLSGAYLLVILSEPMSDQHKSRMIQKLRQGKSQES